MSYLSLDQLLLRIRSGKGLAIVIEGIKNGDDEWVYSQWFGDLAHLVTFYPQDGYSRVYDAVDNLRKKSPLKLIAGIIDRDFATEIEVKSQYDADYSEHIYRTKRYTLENYLLEPEGWLEIASLFWRHKLPVGFRTLEECSQTIELAFKSFLPAAAYNWLVWDLGQKYGPKYYLNFKDTPNLDPEKLYLDLLIYCQREGLPCPDEYELRLNLLKHKKELWPQKVSGKMVFNYLVESIPVPRSRPDKHLFINYYVSRTEAPKELDRLVNFLIAKYLKEASPAKSAV